MPFFYVTTENQASNQSFYYIEAADEVEAIKIAETRWRKMVVLDTRATNLEVIR